ncbi:4Fe-4S binding protein [Methermicoccus shengliensis]|uniref:4Fe-4S binding protein n=1 Tax=Methermicoccus shengliensis TaxID=660064 RepID=A0A832VZ41_9EURY|nr:4Fe-4S binding protein [Methermicoccus shengliensis]KUK04162.1 MAG: 4Fe-4S ferredoxin iron-sulfur binding domain protein [Euryarchaeota archaeon 55_53]KUK29490.1 MAG: 4Fe-4S ferredoxin iron-sulfur binding domain protein [Methanosarcinales archeaon 56_1174]MDI3488349.1 hypothetical protein [Methanosarcinales archaeon]MDN5295826.1 hypothetical protein [Methanosarcinales archaeon]HIH69244.1 4Fe-4S binding protein [Methermicoccus shengliensis]
MPAYVDPETCTGCETCVDECPVEAISMDGEVAKVDPELCTECGLCVDACPAGAISLKEE